MATKKRQKKAVKKAPKTPKTVKAWLEYDRASGVVAVFLDEPYLNIDGEFYLTNDDLKTLLKGNPMPIMTQLGTSIDGQPVIDDVCATGFARATGIKLPKAGGLYTLTYTLTPVDDDAKGRKLYVLNDGHELKIGYEPPEESDSSIDPITVYNEYDLKLAAKRLEEERYRAYSFDEYSTADHQLLTAAGIALPAQDGSEYLQLQLTATLGGLATDLL